METLPIGFDVGTYNLIVSTPEFHTQVNAYLKLNKSLSPTALSTFKKMGVPTIENVKKDGTKELIVVGSKSVEIAADFSTEVKRPMELGCVGSDEESYPILADMLGGMLDKLTFDKGLLYYSIPANAISDNTNIELHKELLRSIFEGYRDSRGIDLTIRPMNEASAIVFSECEDFTGIGISTGAGMVNLSYVKFGLNVFSFSIPQSGDWIDEQVARASNRTKSQVNLDKKLVDISSDAKTSFDLVVKTQYQILIDAVLQKIVYGISVHQGNVNSGKPVPIIIGGGVSSIKGFMDVFKKSFESFRGDIQMEISDVKMAAHGVKAVAHGLHVAAQNELDAD